MTTEQAVHILLELTHKYSSVLSNIIAIKEKKPESEGFVRGGHRSGPDLLKELLEALQALEDELTKVGEGRHGAKGDSIADDAVANKLILSVLQVAIKKMHLSYQGKAKSFAIILTELESAHDILSSKFILPREKPVEIEVRHSSESATGSEVAVAVDEKYVYARIYHRAMEFLGTNKGSADWLPPLLEASKDPERHGIAIYGSEEQVKKSLKGEKYGYLTLQIRQTQDITAKRPPRKDPQLQCALLTIAGVSLNQIIQLVHLGKRYPIVNGKIQGFRGES